MREKRKKIMRPASFNKELPEQRDVNFNSLCFFSLCYPQAITTVHYIYSTMQYTLQQWSNSSYRLRDFQRQAHNFIFFVRKSLILNSWAHFAIANSKPIWRASPKTANPQFFVINLQIPNSQIASVLKIPSCSYHSAFFQRLIKKMTKDM
jgi:hypothetical protein